MLTATALAFANIAFIKYWGNRDDSLRLPANGSLSMNLAGLFTRTRVTFDPLLASDELILGGRPTTGPVAQRVSQVLDLVRAINREYTFARVESENNFPTGAGIASSASAFAALAVASTTAAGLQLSEKELSCLARRGSGSACRSVPGGFVEWRAGQQDDDSYAFSIAPPDHWDLVDCVTVLNRKHKPIGSTQGHAIAGSSPLQAARVADANRRLDLCRAAILERDFEAFATIVELDSNLMHAVMMTSNPPLLYWQPATLGVMHAVLQWRREGVPVCYTIDAGPNVHVLCLGQVAGQVQERLQALPSVVQVLPAAPGGPALLVE